jgi:pimeloyl-ACP methyl ester carboxylesterase
VVAEPTLIHYARTTDGVRIAYSVFGVGGGVPVILIAPIPGSAIVEGRLRARAEGISVDRPAVVYDRRGVGSSQRGVADLSLEALALDIDAIADACHFERFVLWSLSAASLTAIHYAATRPGRCAGLMMGAPTAVGSENEKLMLSLLRLAAESDPEALAPIRAFPGRHERAARNRFAPPRRSRPPRRRRARRRRPNRPSHRARPRA